MAESSRSRMAQSSEDPRSLRLNAGFFALMRRASSTSVAELARGLDPLDAADELRELLFELPTRIREVGGHAGREVPGLADVEERIVLAVEEIDARAFRQFVRERRIDLRWQARQCRSAS